MAEGTGPARSSPLPARKRAPWLALLVLLLFAGLLALLLSRGRPGAPPPPVHRVFAILVRMEISDDLPLIAPLLDQPVSPALDIGPGADDTLLVPAGFLDGVPEGTDDGVLHRGPGIGSRADIEWVLILDRAYAGQARWGDFRSVYLAKGLPSMPPFTLSERFDIIDIDPPDVLFEAVPGPALTWDLTTEGNLAVHAGSERHVLRPGEEVALAPLEQTATVRLGELDEEPTGPEAIVFTEPEEHRFRTQVTVRFAGRLRIQDRESMPGETSKRGPKEE